MSYGYDASALPLMSVLAMLVASVYLRDENPGTTWTEGRWGPYFGCEQQWEYIGGRYADQAELKKLGLAIFLRRSPNFPPHTTKPTLVIVLRGTIMSCRSDLFADVRIAVESLQRSGRFKQTQDLMVSVVLDFLRNGGQQDQICITGHSLGAGLALLVGKHLVSTHGISVDTHLFNPPMMTLVSVVRGKFRPGQQPEVTTARLEWLKILANAVVDTSASREMVREWEEFQRLRHWTPQFYLNPNDIISFQHIRYYKKRHGMGTMASVMSPQGFITREVFGKSAKYIGSTVVPSANLYINHGHRGDLLKAHGLQQWIDSAHVASAEKFQARLLPDMCPQYPPQNGASQYAQAQYCAPQYAPQFAPQFSPQYPPQFDPQFPPQFDPQFDFQFPPQFSPQYPPQFDPRFPPQFDPQFPPQFDPQFPPQFDPQFDSQFPPQFSPQYAPHYPPQFAPQYGAPLPPMVYPPW